MELILPTTFFFGAIHYISDYTNYTSTSILWNPIGRWTGIYADTVGGRVSGTRQISRLGKTFYQFRGIPYAMAPIEELRFEPPRKHNGWEGILDGTYFRSQCPQINMVTRSVVGKEDCLFLNVATRMAYTNENIMTLEDPNLHPVIVFIHGGLFMFGQSNPFGAKYFLDEDVVLVTINYRLNSFGFLNTGDGIVGGNMGLKDQSMALQWVQENIRYFNGDPSRVTIIGESAGSASVHLQTLSKMSRGLFAGAISIGGTALSPWAHVDEPELQSREFGEELGCPRGNGPDSTEMVACLKALPMEKIERYHIGYIYKGAQGKQTVFGPTVDSKRENSSEPIFLSDKPLQILKTGSVSPTPWINGVNSADGLAYLIHHLLAILRNDSIKQTLNSRWDELAPKLLGYQNSQYRSTLNMDVKKYYLNDMEVSSETSNQSSNMLTDRGFFLDSHDAAILQSRSAPTYAFYYDYRGVFAMANLLFYKTPLPLPNDFNYAVGTGIQWMVTLMLNRKQRNNFAVGHGDEMPLLFNIPLIRREVGKNDVDFPVSRNMVRLFVSFAENGIPDVNQTNENESGSKEDVKWDTIQVSNPQLEDIPLKRLLISNEFAVIDEPFYEGIRFWKNHSISYL